MGGEYSIATSGDYWIADDSRRQGRDLRDWMEQALRAWLGSGPVPSLLPVG